MLFADGTAPLPDNWLYPTLATTGAAVAALFAWLTARDKLRYDAQMVQMRAENAAINDRVVTLEADHAKCVDEHERAQQQRVKDQQQYNELVKLLADRLPPEKEKP